MTRRLSRHLFAVNIRRGRYAQLTRVESTFGERGGNVAKKERGEYTSGWKGN